MNVDSERNRRTVGGKFVNQEVQGINKKVRAVMKRMKT